MTPRRPSRWLAPLALLAALAAVFLVVTSTTGTGDGDGDDSASTTEQQDGRQTRTGRRGTTTGRTETGTRTTTAPEQETYTVRPGDTLAVISERTGVPVEEIQELNPDVDPNNLPVGEKIKLTE
ncbi:MAG TPA: LysM domain-containing protein [Solirubrobacteraceae bacterium]|nr:LysM domain-containing protein [Solirubrobacteraceae bacterium]